MIGRPAAMPTVIEYTGAGRLGKPLLLETVRDDKKDSIFERDAFRHISPLSFGGRMLSCVS